ncbi:MAG: DUF262 domain-containing protein [Desulfobaccales bacterium]
MPAYQREYVWKEKEVIQLLEDIYDAFSNNPESEYFLGSLVVCKSRAEAKLEVIDGQQRLITLIFVFGKPFIYIVFSNNTFSFGISTDFVISHNKIP